MKVGVMLRDVMRSLFRRPATRRYPAERRRAPDRLRGLLRFDPTRCTGCSLCEKDCPANALEVITADRARKRFVLLYHVDRCTFCAQCVQSCRFGCLGMSSEDWELAAPDTKSLKNYLGDPRDVETILAILARPVAERPAAP